VAEVENREQQRVAAANAENADWRKWGPYLSERQWGTVREDYSPAGNAWTDFTFEQSHQRAYRWGEDGLAGFSDDQSRLCLGLALWNGRDPILKERLFGLSGPQGNHGEDVKESYFYLDATPSHSYLKMLYKYPQCEFPYEELRRKNAHGDRQLPEYELHDTGALASHRYFDVFVEYAKAGTEDILMQITAFNRSAQAAPLTVLPQLWFRNTWSWGDHANGKPQMHLADDGSIRMEHADLGSYWWHADQQERLLFTENESNVRELFGRSDAPGFFKDAFHEFVVRGKKEAVNPQDTGTKAAALFSQEVPAGAAFTTRVRLTHHEEPSPFSDFDVVMKDRRAEADEFYAELQDGIASEDDRRIHRQALGGMIWSKQFYHYDVTRWLDGDPTQATPDKARKSGRNHEWQHLKNSDIISMPDTWEYPWYAAWDLAFHCIPLALVDAEFAKQQLTLMTREWYMHPNGQLPAYEWAFDDANPPVHAWATWRVFQIDRKQTGKADVPFLEGVFHKLLLNFTWWVNRKDEDNRNVFQGGFLGLDNIGVFDRSAPIPGGGHIDQADGTSWMGMFSLNMMRIAIELARHNPVYENIATKFFEHFLYIAKAMTNIGGEGQGLWDVEDEFYYDMLHVPGERNRLLKVRSLVGLTPLFAVETIEPETLEKLPWFKQRLEFLLNDRPDLAALVSRWYEVGRGERRLMSLLRGHRMKCLLRRLLDETEFLSDYGIRSVSRYHREKPFVFESMGKRLSVDYQPGESTTNMFGGNSNWRGPIWFPMNYLLVESLQKFHHYYGDDFKVECPKGSGNMITINEVATELSRRLVKIFQKDEHGNRPVNGHIPQIQGDEHFADYVPFYEYFHGDTGRGVGASHQTGWTGLVAKLLHPKRDPIH
jgi:hypothetical protein